MKNKYLYLLKNVGLLTISNFGSKILSFILIPIYTSILTTTEYGIYDIYATTISILIPILTLNIYEAVMRYCIDKENKKENIFLVGLKYNIISTINIIVLIFINYYFKIFSIVNLYWYYFILLFISESIYNLFTQFCRGIDKIKIIAIAGIINSIAIVSLNILFLCVFKIGLDGYFLSYIISYLLTCIYIAFSIKIWKYVCLSNDKKYEKDMIKYSFPLIFDTISWWIINISDRYIVTFFCGIAQNGIYSIAYKIPSILNIMQSIFNQAWTLSAVKEYDENNCNFYSNIYLIYNFGMVMICSILLLFNKIIAEILFANEFYEAWRYAPFLMISVVFGALSGLLGGIFNASKNSKILAKTTVIGSIVNIILNIILIKSIGVIGAAISTCIAYIIVWLLRFKKVNKLIKLNIKVKRDIISYIILIIQALVFCFVNNNIYLYLIEFILISIVIILYKKEIYNIKNKLIEMAKNIL